MKKILISLLMLVPFAALLAQPGKKPAAAKPKPPVANGIYYIVNAGNGKAIEPGSIGSGQNVFCREFSDGNDSQQWEVKWTGKSYLIYPRGKNDLLLQPHPGIREATAIISINMGNGGPGIGITATADSMIFVIKSLMNGGTSFFAQEEGNETILANSHKNMGALGNWKFIRVKE